MILKVCELERNTFIATVSKSKVLLLYYIAHQRIHGNQVDAKVLLSKITI